MIVRLTARAAARAGTSSLLTPKQQQLVIGGEVSRRIAAVGREEISISPSGSDASFKFYSDPSILAVFERVF